LLVARYCFFRKNGRILWPICSSMPNFTILPMREIKSMIRFEIIYFLDCFFEFSVKILIFY